MRVTSRVVRASSLALLVVCSCGCARHAKTPEPEKTERAYNYDKVRSEFMQGELDDILEGCNERMEGIVVDFEAYAAPLDVREKDSVEYFDRLHEAERNLDQIYGEGCASIAALKSYDETLADFARYRTRLDEAHEVVLERLHQ